VIDLPRLDIGFIVLAVVYPKNVKANLNADDKAELATLATNIEPLLIKLKGAK
jgi:hypothetical protein